MVKHIFSDQLNRHTKMKNVEQLIGDIKLLSPEERKQIYHDLQEEMLRSKVIDTDIEKYKRIAKHLWEKDAQEFVNELRADERN